MGITALVAASPNAFLIAKLIGAGVLIYLGIRGWMTATIPVKAEERPAKSIYLRALAIATINPKSVAGYLAAFSQFVQPDVPIWDQMGVIIPTALTLTALSYTGFTALGAVIGRAALGAVFNVWGASDHGGLLYHIRHIIGQRIGATGESIMIKGACLCGAVQFNATETSRDPAACHCSQCRKQSGHHWASVNVPMSGFSVTGDVRWFESSATARRGFCPTCGSFLFWKANDEDEIGVSLGSLDSPTGLKLERHIFTADKGDYYDIAGHVPQEEQDNG